MTLIGCWRSTATPTQNEWATIQINNKKITIQINVWQLNITRNNISLIPRCRNHTQPQVGNHLSAVMTKVNRALGFIRRNLYSCPQDIKSTAYKTLVLTHLECSSTVWDPYTQEIKSRESKEDPPALYAHQANQQCKLNAEVTPM